PVGPAGCLACGGTGTGLRAISSGRYQPGECPVCEPVTRARGFIVAKSSSARNHRNDPYVLDRMFVRVHQNAAGTLFRFRTELATITAATAGGWELAKAITLTWAVVTLTTMATVIAALPWTRQFVIRRAWCVLSRHRIQKVCFETRMHTR